ELFSRRMGKQIDEISEETMAAFKSHPWPGNIRELQNIIERAVILANDGVLPNPLPALPIGTSASPAIRSVSMSRDSAAAIPMTLSDSERALIFRTLEATGWVIGGSNGAAAKLGLKRTTLIHRMKKLGIERPARRTISPEMLAAPEPSETPADPNQSLEAC